MSVVYTNAVKISRMNAVTTAAGTTAVLEIGTNNAGNFGTVLATIPLANPIAPAATGAGVLALTMPQSDTTADATGTAAFARIKTASGGTDITTGLTVGVGTGDIQLDSTSITAGQTVTINSASITHAA